MFQLNICPLILKFMYNHTPDLYWFSAKAPTIVYPPCFPPLTNPVQVEDDHFSASLPHSALIPLSGH